MNKAYRSHIFSMLFLSMLVVSALVIAAMWALTTFAEMNQALVLAAGTVLAVGLTLLVSSVLTKQLSAPLEHLAQRIEHVTAEDTTLEPVDTHLGHDLIQHALESLHTIITQAQRSAEQNHSSVQQITRTLNILPYPVLGIDRAGQIVLANQAAAELFGAEKPRDLLGTPYANSLQLHKDNQDILSDWIEMQQAGAVNAEQMWQEIHYSTKEHAEYNFDVWARFIRAEESGVETSLMLIDRTLEREHEDMKVDFVAMAAHDLRAPVTVIRGYIETLQDELEATLTEDQKNFMEKLEASASQLSGFINNILNVDKVDKGRLNLSLQEANWADILTKTIDQLQIRAKTHNKTLELQLDGPLPLVAVDPISITEVVNNFVDNAIKYSGSKSDRVVVACKVNSKGEVETTVQDFGVGIPDSLVGKLFTKYYRSHRTQHEFGGTGLGLFISKAIMDAHHGHVWAQSKEGEGSTFGFSLPPYEQVAATLEDGNLPTITRGSHGWIKNHSLYRR